MLRLQSLECDRVKFDKRRRLDGAPSRRPSPLCPLKTRLAARWRFWHALSRAADLVDAAISTGRARAALLVFAYLVRLAVRVPRTFWRRRDVRDAEALGTLKVLLPTIAGGGASHTSVVTAAHLAIALAIVLALGLRQRHRYQLWHANMINTSLVFAAVCVRQTSTLVTTLLANRRQGPISALSKRRDVLTQVRKTASPTGRENLCDTYRFKAFAKAFVQYFVVDRCFAGVEA